MIAVLLAAGRGTRMGQLTADTPKPLLTLRGKPILVHILDGLRAAGVEQAVIVTGYLGDKIEAALGNGRALGIQLTYRRQTEPNGTAQALLLASDALTSEPFLLSWGDIVVSRSLYREMVDDFTAEPCDALLSVNPVDDPWRGGAVYVDDRMRVTELVEKPPRGTATTGWNNAGIFVFSEAIIAYAQRLQASPRGEYELPQALAAMIADGRRVRAHAVTGYWSDLGTPQDLAAAEQAAALD